MMRGLIAAFAVVLLLDLGGILLLRSNETFVRFEAVEPDRFERLGLGEPDHPEPERAFFRGVLPDSVLEPADLLRWTMNQTDSVAVPGDHRVSRASLQDRGCWGRPGMRAALEHSRRRPGDPRI